MIPPDIQDDDPRILVQEVGPGRAWKNVRRELIRIDGVIWYRLTTVYKTQFDVAGDWTVADNIQGFATDLDRHDLALQHNAAIAEGVL